MQRTGNRARLWAAVPVKLLSRTKQRLAPLLSREERAEFAAAMLEDVLAALGQASSLAGVAVITGDERAAALGRAASALVIPDDENTGISAAAAQAARILAREGCEGMLVVPADVPLITAADVEAIIAAHGPAPAVTLVAASADGGTNALAVSAPGILPFRFGAASFARHTEAARACGIQARALDLPRIARDLDRPGDVAAFMRTPSPTRAYAYLAAIGITERLAGAARATHSSREAASAGGLEREPV